MGVPTFVFMICSLRTNIVYVSLFATILTGFCLLAGSFWHLAKLNVETAHTLQIVRQSGIPVKALYYRPR